MTIRIKYRGSWWWRKVHYNYFHKRLFREFYDQKKRKRLSDQQVRKYRLFQLLDDLITFRKVGWYHTLQFKLDPR